MFLPQILLLTLAALLMRLVTAGEARRWLVLAASVACVFWLQPAMPIRSLDFWLPAATLALAVLGWVLTRKREEAGALSRRDLVTALVVGGLVIAVGLTRFVGGGSWLTASRPPPAGTVLAGVVGLAALLGAAAAGWNLLRRRAPESVGRGLAAAIALIVVLLVWLKTPALALEAARGLRGLMGQNPALAAALDIRWLGFSYVAFRLIHTLRDRQTGRLSAVDLLTYLCYVIFFPALVAGPIDRLERFAKDFNQNGGASGGTVTSGGKGQPVRAGSSSSKPPVDPSPLTQTTPSAAAPSPEVRSPAALGIAARPLVPTLTADAALAGDLTEAGRRILLGLFKKFAVADTLALVALSPANAVQVRETGWLWLIVYLYAFQIYFDFAGYTDIAVGLGRLLGVRLPENFAAPYLKPNLSQFWNSWHMSLTLWFRGYFFNPLVRWLRGRRVSAAAVLLVTQVATMLLIGLWHGVTANFVLWGLWHGLGLFVQNRWTDWARPRFAENPPGPAAARALTVFNTLLTFHFVALGWVLFALPDPGTAGTVLARLFGMGW